MTNVHRISLVDAGCPRFASQCGVGDRFRYWLGSSGQRYLFTAMTAAEITGIEGAVVVFAERDKAGGYRGVDLFVPGDPGELPMGATANRLVSNPNLVAFVHLLAEDAGARAGVVSDLTGVDQRLAA